MGVSNVVFNDTSGDDGNTDTVGCEDNVEIGGGWVYTHCDLADYQWAVLRCGGKAIQTVPSRARASRRTRGPLRAAILRHHHPHNQLHSLFLRPERMRLFRYLLSLHLTTRPILRLGLQQWLAVNIRHIGYLLDRQLQHLRSDHHEIHQRLGTVPGGCGQDHRDLDDWNYCDGDCWEELPQL